MSSNKLMKVGAVAGIILSIFSILVSDMHTVPDLILRLAQGSANKIIIPRGLEFPYWVTGIAAGPILVVSIYLFGLGFIGAWKKTGEKTAQISGIVALIYGRPRFSPLEPM